MNVLVYALPNTNGGGYSVILNLYEDIKAHNYPDIHWYFITGTDGFENTEHITVFNESWALKTYAHRYYFNTVKVKEFVKKYDIAAVISLNMGVGHIKTPSIISLHNVLPLYKCDSSVFDTRIEMIKQRIINHLIIKSLKRAEYIIIPSKWIKRELISKFKIQENKIYISQITVPEVSSLLKTNQEETSAEQNKKTDLQFSKEKTVEFIYPSSGFPYKNHRVIIEAAKKLQQEGIENYYIRLTGNVGEGKTITELKKEIQKNNLPIEFSGMYSKEQLANAYAGGVLLFPSRIETDGFPILESMACGGYIIAADLEYAREALSDYDSYDLFNPQSAEELESLMKKAIEGNNPQRHHRYNFESVRPRTEIIVPLLQKL